MPRSPHTEEMSALVREAREKLDLTQPELAALLGVHLRSIQNWETGAGAPKAQMRRHLRACLSGPKPDPRPMADESNSTAVR